jgi:HD superfamily phosphohydrolase YqeK
MTGFLASDDVAIWLCAKPWLDVRSNDEHTLISYRLAQALLRRHSAAVDRVVLPAVLLHDVGWKMCPEEKLAHAVDPNAKYPELQREHEIEGARIARDILDALTILGIDTERVIESIDGHDTRKHALSLEDALMKDADKLWRFTDHGVATIGGWYGMSAQETLAMLEDFVLPSMLTDTGKAAAEALIAEQSAKAWLPQLMQLRETAS